VTLVLTVVPSINSKGCHATSVRGPLFDVHLDGRRIVERGTTPFCDAARRLLAEGLDPVTPIAMRHTGKDYDALRSTTVEEGKRRPTFRPWKPRKTAALTVPLLA
jgi:hypothetical protein